MPQRRLPFGGRVASVTTRATLASGIDALRPRPGLSASPSRPDLSKRTHHVETRFGVVFNCSATASTPTPLEPKQDHLGTLAVSHPDGGRARPASKLLHDLGSSLQSLDRSTHPNNSPRSSTLKQMIVDICGAEH